MVGSAWSFATSFQPQFTRADRGIFTTWWGYSNYLLWWTGYLGICQGEENTSIDTGDNERVVRIIVGLRDLIPFGISGAIHWKIDAASITRKIKALQILWRSQSPRWRPNGAVRADFWIWIGSRTGWLEEIQEHSQSWRFGFSKADEKRWWRSKAPIASYSKRRARR